MNYSYNGSQFPFPWPNSNLYLTNMFSTTQQPHGPTAPQAIPTVTATTPHPPSAVGPHGPPPGYPNVHGIPATQGIQTNTGGLMYPFTMSGSPYPNTNANPNASGPFDGNWTYSYNNCLGCYPHVPQTVCTNSPANNLVTNNLLPKEDKTVTDNASGNLREAANSDQLSKADLTDEIALKVSSMLTDSGIFKTAMSKLQKPTSQECDKDVTTTSANAEISSDDNAPMNIEMSSAKHKAATRYL